MINLDKAVIARLKKGNETFEVLVDCDKAIEFRQGNGEVEDVLATRDIYKDARKGLHASEHEMEKIFETTDSRKIATNIIKKGEIQLTAEYKNKLREGKRKRVVELIRRNAVDSQTGLPHPPKRIEAAMEEARVKIDEFKSAEDQVQDVLEKIRSVLPIRFEVKHITLKFPSRFAGASYGAVKQEARIIREEWMNDGSLLMEVEIPGGMVEEFYNRINNLTHGEVETKEVGRR